MSEMSHINLSQIICTRISHDLIGNIGAVSNAVELLEEGDADFMDDIRSILKVSSAVLSARLKFFRMAFGLSNANLENREIIIETCKNYVETLSGQKNNPVCLKMEIAASPRYGRMTMLGVMLLTDILIRGGTVSIAEAEGKLALAVTSDFALSADKIENIKSIFTGAVPENQAQYAPAFCLKALQEEQNLSLRVLPGEGFALLIG